MPKRLRASAAPTSLPPLVLLLALGACDLPTDATAARERLARGQSRVVAVDVPLPRVEINLREELLDSAFDLHKVLDDDLNIAISADSFAVTLAPFDIDVADLAPTVETFDLSVSPFNTTFSLTTDPVAVEFAEQRANTPLPPVPTADTTGFQLDFSDEFTTATFAPGTMLGIRLRTETTGQLTGARAVVKNDAGQVVSQSTNVIDVDAGEVDTLRVPLGDRTLSARFTVEVSFASAQGGLSADSDLFIRVFFLDAKVSAATGVAVERVQPVTVSESVLLDQTGTDFTEAVLETGTLAVTGFQFGGLRFTAGPGFETNLAGKRVGGTSPSTVQVQGTVAPPTGVSRVDVTTAGSVTARVSDVRVSTARLTSVNFSVNRLVDVVDEDEGQLRGLTSAVLRAGNIRLDLQNRMPVSGSLTIVLEGALRNGQPLTQTVSLPAAGASPGTAVMNFNLNGVTLVPAQLKARVSGALAGSNVTVTRAVADAAFRVTPTATIQASVVTVQDAGPDFNFDFRNEEEFTKQELDLDGSEDLLRDISLNDVELRVTIRNPTGVQITVDSTDLVLSSFPDGAPVNNASGVPIRTRLQEGATGKVVIPARGSKTVAVQASELVSRLVNRLSRDQRTGIVAVGKGSVVGSSGTISTNEQMGIFIEVVAPLDLTLPTAGARVDRVSHDVVDLEGKVADLISDTKANLESADVVLEITNPVPVALSLDLALSPRHDDPFQASKKLVIRNVSIPAAPAGPNGAATGSTQATVTVVVPTADLDVFKEGQMSLGVVATLLPPTGGRTRVQGDETIVVVPTGKFRISTIGGR